MSQSELCQYLYGDCVNKMWKYPHFDTNYRSLRECIYNLRTRNMLTPSEETFVEMCYICINGMSIEDLRD